jgi:hypothetical protein
MRILLLALAACAAPIEEGPPPPEHPCSQDQGAIDVAPPHGDFGELVDGGTLWCGNPPQGGAPYSPFRLRIQGAEGFEDGVLVEMTAADLADGSELAFTSLTMGLTCANVGESAGMWVGSEAHMRYNGYGLDELDGRSAEITFRATAQADPELWVETVVDVELVLD